MRMIGIGGPIFKSLCRMLDGYEENDSLRRLAMMTVASSKATPTTTHKMSGNFSLNSVLISASFLIASVLVQS